jgi:hypothetical protein
MESILAILCIVFFAVLTYGLVQGSNITKYHLDDCRTIYIPEEIDLETAYKSIKGKNLNALKKRARELGASKIFVDTFKDEKESKLKLSEYIIRNSISDEHILLEDVGEKIKKKEADRMGQRINEEVDTMKLTEMKKLSKDLDIPLKPESTFKQRLKAIMLEQTSGNKELNNMIQALRKDAGMD